MKTLGLGAAVAALAMTCATTAGAQAPTSRAEQVRQLDIMLMVTSLRCRNTADDFVAEYGRFTASHLTELNQASDELRLELKLTGARDARALDRVSTTIANRYGQGHPWLSCAELKTVAADLAEAKGRSALESAAGILLGDGSPTRIAGTPSAVLAARIP